MPRYFRHVLACTLFLLVSISLSAQAPELYWGLNINPQRGTGYPNMVWYNATGLPGIDPIPASPLIPMAYGEWTSEGGPWWLDAVQVQGQPAVLLVLTTGYRGELRAFRTTGGVLQPCGSYSLSLGNGENGGVRVSPSGSFAVVIVGTNPQGYGSDLLLRFPLNLMVPHNPFSPCLLPGTPVQYPVPNNTAIRNVDFNPKNNQEVVITGYSNNVTFMNPQTGGVICAVQLPSQLTRLEARYSPDAKEVWVSSYDGQQIAVITPPPGCAVTTYITNGFSSIDNLAGGSFHPDPTVGLYYVVSYPGNNLFAVDTASRKITGVMQVHAQYGTTAVTRGHNGTYLLEAPLAGCYPCFSHTDTYDVTSYNDAHNLSNYKGSHNSSGDMSRVATVRDVQK